MSLIFSRPELEDELNKINWRLSKIILPRVVYHAGKYDTYVTSVIRVDPTSVHGNLRGLDVDFVGANANELGQIIAKQINRHIKYGRTWTGRKGHCAIWHKNRGTPGYHLHLQVPVGGIKIL